MSESDVSSDSERPITVEWILELLVSRVKIGRERGIAKLEKLLKSWENGEVDMEEAKADKLKLQEEILNGLLEEDESRPPSASIVDHDSDSNRGTPVACISRSISRTNSTCEELQQWEKKHGYLMACYPLIASKTKSDDDEFLLKIQNICINLLKHPEVRVQLVAGGVLGFMSKYVGPAVYINSKDVILDLINTNLGCTISEEDELKSAEQGFDVNLPAFIIRDKVIKESQGWKHLEPSLKCLQFFIENLEADFIPFMEPKIIQLVFQFLAHPIRYVRENGFQIVAALIAAAPEDMKESAHQLSKHLANGLSDNWNQVRMAAAIATRKFFLTYKENKEEFYPVLLPKLCLNRYYKAEGIRDYVQNSWKLIVGDQGRFLVAKYIDDIVTCYINSTLSTNLAEREAACACISELASKIEPTGLKDVPKLLDALISQTKNESWSVRDAACLSCGNFILHYPEESKPRLDELYDILFQNLGDPIQLLRQAAASALGNIAVAYGQEALKFILPKLHSGLTGIEAMKKVNSDLVAVALSESGTEASEENHGHIVPDENACIQHEPQCEFALPGKILVTSESLMRMSAASGGAPAAYARQERKVSCLGCRRSKMPQAWHLTDGCLYLVGSLTNVESKRHLDDLVPLMLKATEEKSYLEHYTVHETFCKVIPLLAKAIGKRAFKDWLQQIFDPIFYTVECVNPMTSAVGKQCLMDLSEFLGPNILRSRVELYDPRFVNLIPDYPNHQLS